MPGDPGGPLYRRGLLRRAPDPAGAGPLAPPPARPAAPNPACGDRITVELALQDGRVTAIAHVTQACVLTQASAALLAGAAPGEGRLGLAGRAGSGRAFPHGPPPPPRHCGLHRWGPPRRRAAFPT